MTANSMERINLEQTVGMLMPPPQIKERLNLIRSLLNDIGQLPERGPVMLVKDPAGKHLVPLREYMVVGTEKSCDILLSCPYISRKHFRIFFKNDDWIVLDEHSTNGIFVNGTKKHCALLKNGDIIQLGTVTLVFLNLKQAHQQQGASQDLQ